MLALEPPVAQVMTRKGHLPVVRKVSDFVIISIGEVAKHRVKEIESASLRDYISSQYGELFSSLRRRVVGYQYRAYPYCREMDYNQLAVRNSGEGRAESASSSWPFELERLE
jgi:hypothetical protein